MDINTLKDRIEKYLPIYCGEYIVEVYDIYEDFGLVEVDWVDGLKKYIVDVKVLSQQPRRELTINLNLLKPRKEIFKMNKKENKEKELEKIKDKYKNYHKISKQYEVDDSKNINSNIKYD